MKVVKSMNLAQKSSLCVNLMLLLKVSLISVFVEKLKIKRKKKGRKKLLKNKSFTTNLSNLNLTSNGLIDIDRTYDIVKKLEYLKSIKNSELRKGL